jgi:hypothetical protein
MPTITVRVTHAARQVFERRAKSEGVTLSEWTRRAMESYEGPVDESGRLDEFERRLARLEEMAGL